jgi:outer membrane protein OmpA-like peptidoglycan-associated protein
MVEKRTNAPVPAPKPVVVEPAPEDTARKNAAVARLRAVEVLRGRCLERDCRASHPSDWAQADGVLQQAAADQANGDWAGVQAKADQAHGLLEAMLSRPTFVMPATISGIRKVGNQLMLTPPVTFTSGGGAIEPSALPTINALADLLKRNDAAVVRLRIVGHTDSRGSATGNQRLSERRANTVRTALIDLGVDAGKISAEGMGEANPIASNKTAAGRERNRRVEFLITVKQ